ncbi:MAG TPA: carboxymuconolactone decarboxylase family protein [Longimicrobium sp.]|jgi:AhpD family alkylhydroperoxidase|uniref:carboxymuconolactone decarboxylase family protein n=1 Tax=Longimicrobium sp. TaxID=2029185 RepID=UPI002EDB48EE
MHLTPIERPSSPLLRLLYRLSARRFGTVIGPLRVIYARRPRLLVIAGQIARTMEHGLSLDPALRFLVQTQTARQNGCTFCADLALAEAVRSRVGHERFRALDEYRTSPLFTERERAALAFAEEATRNRRLSDETAAAVRAAFSEEEIVDLAWLNAAENYFNLQAAVLGIESDGLAAMALAKGDARRS